MVCANALYNTNRRELHISKVTKVTEITCVGIGNKNLCFELGTYKVKETVSLTSYEFALAHQTSNFKTLLGQGSPGSVLVRYVKKKLGSYLPDRKNNLSRMTRQDFTEPSFLLQQKTQN